MYMVFDVPGTLSIPSAEFSENVIIFVAHVSSSVHVDNKKKIS